MGDDNVLNRLGEDFSLTTTVVSSTCACEWGANASGWKREEGNAGVIISRVEWVVGVEKLYFTCCMHELVPSFNVMAFEEIGRVRRSLEEKMC